VNLPSEFKEFTTHRYGPNTFKLHRLPLPRPGRVLGLLGTNGIGKSAALSILAGRLKPNLGEYHNPPTWKNIIARFRGSELQNYFARLIEDKLKTVVKPQYVERFAAFEQISDDTCVRDVVARKDDKNISDFVFKELDVIHLLNREIGKLSGGELQRVAIASLCVQNADVYVVDEPSAFLDIRQRLRAAHTIRGALLDTTYVVVVEHDLAVLDLVSDLVCCLWGSAGVYGVVTTPFSSSEGINHFLAGYIPTENLRIRDEALTFRIAGDLECSATEQLHTTAYPRLKKTLANSANEKDAFSLEVEAGSFASSEIIVMLGEKGTGKTTLIRLLAQKLDPDGGIPDVTPRLCISWKPQMFVPSFEGTVRELLLEKINATFLDPLFQSDVVRPLCIEHIAHLRVKTLSGGELQRVALVLTLGRPADVYLIDEPSAYLDVEQRIAAARVLRRFILHQKKTAFVVEHDFVMATYLADRVIVFNGQPGVRCCASPPMPLCQGMNQFLCQLGITIRRGKGNGRPRINKIGGTRDSEQKLAGNYFLQAQV